MEGGRKGRGRQERRRGGEGPGSKGLREGACLRLPLGLCNGGPGDGGHSAQKGWQGWHV